MEDKKNTPTDKEGLNPFPDEAWIWRRKNV